MFLIARLWGKTATLKRRPMVESESWKSAWNVFNESECLVSPGGDFQKDQSFFLSESLRRTAGDEKLSDQFGASARTANQRRRGHLGDPEASVNHQVPHGYFKDSRYETLVVDLWLQELYRNFALSDFQICFFPWLEGGRVAVARIRRGFSEWFDMLTLLWMLRPH